MYKNIFFEKRKHKIHLWDDRFGYKQIDYKPYCYYPDEEGQYVSVFGDRLKKKWFNKIYDLREFKDSWKTFEADIKPDIRTLIDLYHTVDPYVPDINTAYLDIEVRVNPDDGFPDPVEARFPINAITLYTSSDDTFRTYVLNLDGQHRQSEEHEVFEYEGMRYENVKIRYFDTEDELLVRFAVDFGSLDINLYGGWNSFGFDVPYIFNRVLNECGQHVLNRMSKIGIVEIDNGYRKYKIAGTDHLDYLELYKKFQMGGKSSYKLDSVAEDEIGENKLEYDGWLGDLYYSDLDRFIAYNIHDAGLVRGLDEKLNYYDVARMLCHRGNVPYDTVMHTTSPIDGAILTYLKKSGKVAPNKPTGNVKRTFAGAYVADPIIGMHEYVIDLDFTSLYPSIIRTLNISPETKLKKYDSFSHAMMEGNMLPLSGNFVAYDDSKRGVIPSILDIWFAERVEFKNKMKEHRLAAAKMTGESKKAEEKLADDFDLLQYATKIQLNSTYGCLGLNSFRFFDLDNAEEVTLTGQASIKHAISSINNLMEDFKFDGRVLACDTDSLFVSMIEFLNKFGVDLNDSDACVSTILDKILPSINAYCAKSMDEFAKKELNCTEHHLHLKQELIARRIFFVAKKRYGYWAINEEGVPVNEKKYMGLDVKRSSFAPYYKDGSLRVFNDLLEGCSEKHVQDMIDDLISGSKDVPLKQIATPTGVSKIRKLGIKGLPVAERAALVHNEVIKKLGIREAVPIVPASKVRWVYLIKNNPFGHNVIAFTEDSPKELLDAILPYVDHDVMNDKNIIGKLEPVLSACKMEMPDRMAEIFKDYFS